MDKSQQREAENIFTSLADPAMVILKDKPLLRRFGKAMLAGGSAVYVPAAIIMPTRGARRGAFFFGAGIGFGWTLRTLIDNVIREGDNSTFE